MEDDGRRWKTMKDVIVQPRSVNLTWICHTSSQSRSPGTRSCWLRWQPPPRNRASREVVSTSGGNLDKKGGRWKGRTFWTYLNILEKRWERMRKEDERRWKKIMEIKTTAQPTSNEQSSRPWWIWISNLIPCKKNLTRKVALQRKKQSHQQP